MINSKDFSVRLEKVIEYFGETASSFSDKIGVQRSSISHILSGRNKPSLDFIMKILTAYPEVELYWLINGKGAFPQISKPLINKDTDTSNKDSTKNISTHGSTKSIDRIVVFYEDGTFKNYLKEE